MPRAPVESPIALSSASPTPDRQIPGPTRRGRRSSSAAATTAGTTTNTTAGPSARPTRPLPSRSRPSHDFDDPFALPGPSRPVRGTHPRGHAFTLTPTAPEFQPARSQGLAIPSRPDSVASGSSRNTTEMDARAGARAGQSRTEAIDLTEDDDDVEVVAVTQAPRARRTGPTGPLWRDLHRELVLDPLTRSEVRYLEVVTDADTKSRYRSSDRRA